MAGVENKSEIGEVQAFTWLVGQMAVDWRPYAASALFALARALWPVAVAWNIAMFVDGAVGNDRDRLVLATLYGIFIYAGAALGNAMHQISRTIATTSSVHRIRTKALELVQRSAVKDLTRLKEGDIESRINDDPSNAANTLAWQVMNALVAPVVQGMAAFWYLFTISRPMALLVVGLGPSVAAIFAVQKRLSMRYQRELRDLEAGLNHFVQDTWSGAIVIRCFQLYERAQAIFSGRSISVYRVEQRLARTQGFGWGALLASAVSVQALALYISLRGIQVGSVSPGELVASINLVGTLQLSFVALGDFWPGFQAALVCSQRALHLWRLPQENETDAAASVDNVVVPEVKFEKVCFSYEPRASDGTEPGCEANSTPPIGLRDVSFTVPAGRTLAVVGPTGSGKTTLIRLLLRLYEPTSGQILIGGTDVSRIPLPKLRSSVAYVAQDGYLFQGSVRDNILFGEEQVGSERLTKALRLAQLDEALMEHERGLEADVGERGTKFSGGEIQRIALARALLRDAPLVVLDEATSALDSIAERSILENLENEFGMRTCIVVTHRLAAARYADCVVVLDRGRVVEKGTHDELLKLDGKYAQLARSAAPESDSS